VIRGGLVTLFVRDLKRSVRFYVETLGMKLVEEGGSGWAVVDAGDGFRIGLHEGGEVAGRGAFAPTVGLYPKIPIREAMAVFENRGVTFDTKDDGPVTLAHFRDPDDNVLYLCQER
jgi:catechol 2,3-dioxygenase-like lactoylglutathione lyase family enzyme